MYNEAKGLGVTAGIIGTAAGLAQQTQQPQRDRSIIEQSVDSLAAARAQLWTEIDALRAQLSPVSRSQPSAAGSTKNEERPAYCDLDGALCAEAAYLRSMAATVQDMRAVLCV